MGQEIISCSNPPDAKTLENVRLFAVLGTWMEADVVAATVRNAITQGCERVYVIDNDSPDDTVKIACQEGAILARSYRTERYDESLRLRHMNEAVCHISQSEKVQHIWWLFLDADEFPHGPSGMTLLDYLKTLDQKFRVVGTRFFDHYPGSSPQYVAGRHPLDFQLLCEELAYPMCGSKHRKHPLQRYDKDLAAIECGAGFHLAHCAEQLYEPSEPAFLHHFPFRDEELTRRRLQTLWTKSPRGVARAFETRDTHMLARFRSLDAVYSREWQRVQNFLALDPLNDTLELPSPLLGVNLKPWPDQVEAEHVPVLRWYSTSGVWKYENVEEFRYGDDTTYQKGLAFLDGHGTIEDWGCGFAHAKSFIHGSRYVGVDGSSPYADKNVDLSAYTSDADCIFIRHVLEHNLHWRRILANALASFRNRMVLIIFTPWSESTRVIRVGDAITSVPVPDISFRKEDITECFKHFSYREETYQTDTQYKIEHVFFIDRQASTPRSYLRNTLPRADIEARIARELDEWTAARMKASIWWRDDDARSDTSQLRHLLNIAQEFQINPALAVVPRWADDSLARLVSGRNCCVWQHGWMHDYHVSGEFGDGRPLELMIRDAVCGQRALDNLFGKSGWQPVFVPPNHSLSMTFKPFVPYLGYVGLSAGEPLTPRLAEVLEVNAELDIMNWQEGRVWPESTLCEMVIGQLKSRRMREVPSDSPMGILTHHLVLDDEAWNLVRRLLGFFRSHEAVTMLRADKLFDMHRLPTGQLSRAIAVGRRPEVTVVLTSCGRPDLLARTLDSFFKYNTYAVREFIVIEDGEVKSSLADEKRYLERNIRWLYTGRKVGQILAIDLAYRLVSTPYIFHCEDDWEFIAPGFIEKSMLVLEQNSNVLQVWIRGLKDTNGHPIIDTPFFADGTPFRLMQPGYPTREWGTWHGFSFNPGLRRLREYLLIGSYRSMDPLGEKQCWEIEREVSEFYAKQRFLAAILADNDSNGYVRHIGWGRRVGDSFSGTGGRASGSNEASDRP